MSGDQLDLDEITEHHGKFATEDDCVPCYWNNPHLCETLALVAEVRRLRESEARVLAWVETWERESVERGPNDKIHSAGAAALLRLALRHPAMTP